MRRLWAWICGWFRGRVARPTTLGLEPVRPRDASVHLSQLLHESQERHRLALQDMLVLREERDRLAVVLKAERDRWLGMPAEAPVAESIVVEYPRAPRVGGITAEAATEIVALLFKVLENPPAEKELPEALWVSFDALLKAYVAMDSKPKDDVRKLQIENAVMSLPEWCRDQTRTALLAGVGGLN